MNEIIVGRVVQTQQLQQALQRTISRRRTQTVLLRGSAGIGKTTLVQEWLGGLHGLGRMTMIGVADRLDVGIPYAAIREALADLRAQENDDVDISAAVDDVVASLGPVVSDNTAAPREDMQPQAAIERLLSLADTPARQPVMVIEDLQCADEETLAMCSALARHHSGPPITLVLTVRPGYLENADEFVGLIERQAERDLATIIDLEPLTADAVAELLTHRLGGLPAPELLDIVMEQTRGNAFFINLIVPSLEVDATIRDDGRLTVPDGWQPSARHDLLLRRVYPGSDEARVAASLAAMGRITADKIHLAAICAELDEEQTRDRIDSLIATGVLAEAGSGWEFAHPLVREASRHIVGPHARKAIHRRMADHMMAQHEAGFAVDMFELVSQICLGYHGLTDDQLNTIKEAAGSAIDTAPSTSAAWIARARTMIPADDPRQADLVVTQLLGLTLCAKMHEAHEVAQEAFRTIAPKHHTPQLIELLATYHFIARQPTRCIALIATVPPDQRTLWMRAVATLCLCALWRLDEARAEFTPLFDDLARDPNAGSPFTLTSMARAASILGLPDEFDRIVMWVQATAWRASPAVQQMMQNTPVTACQVSRTLFVNPPIPGKGYAGEPVMTLRQTAFDGMGSILAAFTYSQFGRGQWDSLLQRLPSDLAELHVAGNLLALEFPAAVFARLLILRDELDEAERILAMIGEPSGVYDALIACSRGQLLAARGDLDGAIEIMERTHRRALKVGYAYLTPILTDALCETLVAAGDDDCARLTAQRSYDWLHPLRAPLIDLHVNRALARGTGDVEAARASVAFAVEAEFVFEEARSRAVLAAAGDEPRKNLQLAHATFVQLRARTERRKAEALMRKLRIPVPRMVATATTLTPVEGEIVKLVALGRTTREIAEELHYSPKTVEMHLSRIYTRTGFLGRVALSRAFTDGALTILG